MSAVPSDASQEPTGAAPGREAECFIVMNRGCGAAELFMQLPLRVAVAPRPLGLMLPAAEERWPPR